MRIGSTNCSVLKRELEHFYAGPDPAASVPGSIKLYEVDNHYENVMGSMNKFRTVLNLFSTCYKFRMKCKH